MQSGHAWRRQRANIPGWRFDAGATLLDLKSRSLTVPSVLLPYLSTARVPFDLVAKTTVTAGARWTLPLPDAIGNRYPLLHLDRHLLTPDGPTDGAHRPRWLITIGPIAMALSGAVIANEAAQLIPAFHGATVIDAAAAFAAGIMAFATRSSDLED
jgi:hypothetical protein